MKISFRSIICILFALVAFSSSYVAGRSNDFDKFFRERKQKCIDTRVTAGGCKGIHIEFAQNCIYKCISAEGFDKIYSSQLLLPGETDGKRERDFKSFMRDLFTQCKKKRVEGSPECVY